jgi:general secretion pathway protein C
MQRNTSIYTFIVLALLTILAYFFAYAANTIVSGMLGADHIERFPALDKKSENTLPSGQPEDHPLNKNITAPISAESSPESKDGSGQANGTADSLKNTTWFFPVRTLDRTTVLASTRNLKEVLMQARAEPYLRHGKTAGLKISRITPGSLYEKIGLQNGDIIIRINNRNLDNPAGFLKLYQELKNKRYISVFVYRQGHQQTLNYDIY